MGTSRKKTVLKRIPIKFAFGNFNGRVKQYSYLLKLNKPLKEGCLSIYSNGSGHLNIEKNKKELRKVLGKKTKGKRFYFGLSSYYNFNKNGKFEKCSNKKSRKFKLKSHTANVVLAASGIVLGIGALAGYLKYKGDRSVARDSTARGGRLNYDADDYDDYGSEDEDYDYSKYDDRYE